jgi:outer membrane protein OmpA-like peptidoglycan-associated protein
MEFIMQKNRYFPLTLIAVAILAGCAAPKNSSLTEAHSSYDSARSNPQVTNLAALELKQAGDSLNKADDALSKRESTDTVNQLAYIAKQQVAIAQETAKRKTAELAVTNASAKRDQVRLEARTAEADAAKQQVAIMQGTADQQTAALAAAGANAERDQALIAQQEMQLKELNAKKTERGLVITLGDVLFSTNKAQLKSGGMRNVQKLADFLKQYPQHKVLVEGYTDSTGSNSLNQELSDRRANAVRTALIDMGISSDRVTTRGYGEAFPVAGNDTAASRQLNRRVEIILSDENGNIAPR